MKDRQTFEEQWPETHEEQFFNGRNYQEQYRLEDNKRDKNNSD